MRQISLVATALLVSALVSVACSNKTVIPQEAATARNDKSSPSAEVTAEWVKNKKDRVDTLLWITNLSSSPLYIKQSSFHAELEGVKVGALNTPAFIEIQPGERRQQVAIFKFGPGKAMAGNLVVTIDPIVSGVIEKPGKTLPALKLSLPVVQK